MAEQDDSSIAHAFTEIASDAAEAGELTEEKWRSLSRRIDALLMRRFPGITREQIGELQTEVISTLLTNPSWFDRWVRADNPGTFLTVAIIRLATDYLRTRPAHVDESHTPPPALLPLFEQPYRRAIRQIPVRVAVTGAARALTNAVEKLVVEAGFDVDE